MTTHYEKGFHDVNAEWRTRFTSDRDRYLIGRGYRPCTACGKALTLTSSGICVPCRKAPCSRCGKEHAARLGNKTGMCNDCRQGRVRRKTGVE